MIVCYDIPDDRRRTRVAKTLQGYGERIQYSVFLCDLDGKRLARLRGRLAQLARADEDDVRIERADRIWHFGRANGAEDRSEAWVA